MTVYQALMRPIEIDYGSVASTDTNPSFQLTATGGIARSLYIGDGVYGSIHSLLYAINTAIISYGGTERFLFTSPSGTNYALVGIITIPAKSCAIKINDPKLARALGYYSAYGSFTAAQSTPYTGNHPPTHCFFSPHQFSSRDRWWSRNRFAGAKSSAGNVSGFILGPQLYERKFEWAANTYTFIDQEITTYTINSVTYYPNDERSWQTFLSDVMSANPTTEAAAGTKMKGFYFFPNGDVITGTYPATSNVTGSGGIHYSLASSPDYYTWCAPDVETVKAPKHFLPVGRDYHNLSLNVTTATAPTWTNNGVIYKDTPA